MSDLIFVFDWDYTLGPSSWEFEKDQVFSETEREAIQEKNKERYASWKAGELTLLDWFELNLEDFSEGGYIGNLSHFEDYDFFDGAKELFNQINERGLQTAAVSVGFSPLIEFKAEELGIDEVYVTEFDMTRPFGSRIINMVCDEFKADLIKTYQDEGKTVVYVGDGDSDIPAFKVADYAVFIPGKEYVHESSNAEKICKFMYTTLEEFSDDFEGFLKKIDYVDVVR